MKIHVYLDESGSIHKNSRATYFVIGGYLALGDFNQVCRIISKYKKINKRHKKARCMALTSELKTRQMTVSEKVEILTKIQLADFVANTMYMRMKDFDLVRDVIRQMDAKKFRLGLFPGKGIMGRNYLIHFPNPD